MNNTITPTPWLGHACRCGQRGCDKWLFENQWAEGMFTKEDFDFAKLAVDNHARLVDTLQGLIYGLPELLENGQLSDEEGLIDEADEFLIALGVGGMLPRTKDVAGYSVDNLAKGDFKFESDRQGRAIIKMLAARLIAQQRALVKYKPRPESSEFVVLERDVFKKLLDGARCHLVVMERNVLTAHGRYKAQGKELDEGYYRIARPFKDMKEAFTSAARAGEACNNSIRCRL